MLHLCKGIQIKLELVDVIHQTAQRILFAYWDRNRDGKISKKEFKSCLSQIFVAPTPTTMLL